MSVRKSRRSHKHCHPPNAGAIFAVVRAYAPWVSGRSSGAHGCFGAALGCPAIARADAGPEAQGAWER